MERRPHWDDYLIQTVRNQLLQSQPEGYAPITDNEVGRVIAAVEDWQAVTVVPTQILEAAQQVMALRAQIQAVQELCQSAIDESYLSDVSIARAAMATRILAALDGA